MANESAQAHESAYPSKVQAARDGAWQLIDELIEDVKSYECASDPNACWAHIFNSLKDKMEENGDGGPLMVAGLVAELITLTIEAESAELTTPSPSDAVYETGY